MHSESRWVSLRNQPWSLDLPDRIQRHMRRVGEAANTCEAEGTRVADWLGVPAPNVAADLERVARLLDHLAEGGQRAGGVAEP